MLFFIFILGLLFGSFANVLVIRTRSKEQFLMGSSHCPKCKKDLRWFHNIPVVSFVFLGGKCGYCKTKISWQYPLVEMLTGFLFLVAGWKAGFGWNIPFESGIELNSLVELLFLAIFAVISVSIFVYDIKWMEIPDGMIVAGIVSFAGYFLAKQLLILGGQGFMSAAAVQLGGGIILFGFFFLQHYFSGGRWVGGGDVKLGFLLGMIVGIKNVFPLIVIAYVLGSVVAIGLILAKKKDRESQIAFGPFLITATWLVIIFSQQIEAFLF